VLLYTLFFITLVFEKYITTEVYGYNTYISCILYNYFVTHIPLDIKILYLIYLFFRDLRYYISYISCLICHFHVTKIPSDIEKIYFGTFGGRKSPEVISSFG